MVVDELQLRELGRDTPRWLFWWKQWCGKWWCLPSGVDPQTCDVEYLEGLA